MFDEYIVFICVKDGSGLYYFGLCKYLVEFVKSNNIDYKVDIYLFYVFDVSVVINVGNDIVYGLIGLGIDVSYVYECIYCDLFYYIEKLVYVYLFLNILK